MTPCRTLTVAEAEAGRSVKSLLAVELEFSSSRISRLKRMPHGICLNGRPVYTTVRVKAGDTLSAFTGDLPDSFRPEPMDIPLSPVYEDEDLLVINKPAGIAVHASTRAPGEPTIENALAAYLPPSCGMHPVSRLDKGTTGLMTIAKSGYIHELMKRRQYTPAFVKTYLALCVGTPQPLKGLIDAPLGYAAGSRYKIAVAESGMPAATAYETLSSSNGLSLVRLYPKTGRTHQIRVHMASIGCPLFGDWLYGQEDTHIQRPALHAASLHIVHPISGETLCLQAPLPADMAVWAGTDTG